MFNLNRLFFCLLILSLLWIHSCNFFENPEDETVITIGDSTISRKEVRKEIDRIIFDMGITDQDLKTNIKSIINKIVEKRLILEYGKRNGITLSPDELESAVKKVKQGYTEEDFNAMLLERYIDIKEWKETFKEELLLKKIVNSVVEGAAVVTFEEAKEYYEKHLEEFRHPRLVQVRQIVTKTREDMEKVLILMENGQSMAELAKKYSIAPEAKNDGMLGWIAEGELDEKIDKFIFSLKEGKLSKILESPYGFHVFKILAVKEEGIKEFPEAMKEIESKLAMDKKEVLYKKWLNGLKKEFPVRVKENLILADMKMEE